MKFLLLLALTLVAAALTTHSAPRPHVVVFLADDLGALDTSVHGSLDARTPHMQRLAAAGMTFERAYVASPSCAPSRAALLTGLMPARNGCEANHSKARPELKKLPAYFAGLGYEVAAFGKVAHYGHSKFYGFEKTAFEGFHDYRGIPAAVEFLKTRDRAKPLCLFVGTNWPHRPWPESADGYDAAKLTLPPTQVDTPETRAFRARYLAAVTRADTDLGIIYGAAREQLGENTLFLFSSDHGAQWPFGKWNCYEAGVRAPLIVAWPGVVKAGARTDAMVSWVDILPTLVEAAGGNAASDSTTPLDGRSFLPVLRGEKMEHCDRIFTTHSGDKEMNVYPIRSIRTGDWKYIRNLRPEFKFTSHVDRAKVADEVSYFRSWEAVAATDPAAAAAVRRYHRRPREELYDLRADPHELHNLATVPQHAARLADMRRELEDWMRDQGDEGRVFNEPVLLDKEPSVPAK